MMIRFIMLIYAEISRILGVFTFIGMMITTSESLTGRKVFYFLHFSLRTVEITCSVGMSMKKGFTSGPAYHH